MFSDVGDGIFIVLFLQLGLKPHWEEQLCCFLHNLPKFCPTRFSGALYLSCSCCVQPYQFSSQEPTTLGKDRYNKTIINIWSDLY